MNILAKEEKRLLLQWLRNLLAKELSSEQLQALQAVEFRPFFAFLAELGFAEQSQKLQTELEKLRLYDDPRLELAADFTQCFLLDGKASALPYASAYLQDPELSQNLAKMDHYLDRFQLQINRQTNEPSDHLAVYLEILLKLLEQEKPAEAATFIQTRLLIWLPQFVEKTEKTDITTKFYPTVAALLLAVLKSGNR